MEMGENAFNGAIWDKFALYSVKIHQTETATSNGTNLVSNINTKASKIAISKVKLAMFWISTVQI